MSWNVGCKALLCLGVSAFVLLTTVVVYVRRKQARILLMQICVLGIPKLSTGHEKQLTASLGRVEKVALEFEALFVSTCFCVALFC